jgi:hypothetical protein
MGDEVHRDLFLCPTFPLELVVKAQQRWEASTTHIAFTATPESPPCAGSETLHQAETVPDLLQLHQQVPRRRLHHHVEDETH